MNDLTDITIFNASASCSKCTVRRRNQPISDRTTMQFLLNDQFALNAKRQKENEQKENEKSKTKDKKIKTNNTKTTEQHTQNNTGKRHVKDRTCFLHVFHMSLRLYQ